MKLYIVLVVGLVIYAVIYLLTFEWHGGATPLVFFLFFMGGFALGWYLKEI